MKFSGLKISPALLLALFSLLLLMLCSSALNAEQQDDWGSSFEDDWGDGWNEDEEDSDSGGSVWLLSGFIDTSYGVFTEDNPVNSEQSIAEIRNHFSAQRYFGNAFFSAKLELIADDVESEVRPEARDLFFDVPVADNWNIKAGQQVLTWGTGDFVFLNDFFPKDWQAMFSGRDDDYLKAPSASVKLSYFGEWAGLDMVVTPDFTHDNYITGERFSYFNPVADDIVAAPPKIRSEDPGSGVEHAQYFARLFKAVDGVEYAAYFYRGYYTQPFGV